MEKRFYKIIVIRRVIFKPAVNHSLEHDRKLLVGKPQEIALIRVSGINGGAHDSQAATYQEKAPNSIDILVKLLKYNLFVHLNT